MPVNSYFQNFSYAREQDLIEDLIIESIQIYGYDVRYIPRTLVAEDKIFWEDRLSEFTDAVELEMYIKNVEGFEGEGDFLSKFNLEIRDQTTFTVARKRFDEATSMKMITERGDTQVGEEYDTTKPSRQFLDTPHDEDEFEYEANTFGYYTITRNRPQEGDLIYFPLNRKLFEIKFVEHEDVFYQTGRLQTYDIRCEMFEYSSERLNTGNTEIDAIETTHTTDIIPEYAMLLEDNDNMVFEDGDFMVEEYQVETTQPTADNTYIEDQAFNEYDRMTTGIVDFSESNPFSEDF
jgi:hypothetical protein